MKVEEAGAEFFRSWAFGCSAEGGEDELDELVEGAGAGVEAEREGKEKSEERAARLRV